MPKSKTSKSVSFQHLAEEDSTSLSSAQANQASFPVIESPFLTIPFHYILALSGAFYYGLTSDTTSVMVKGIPTLIAIQFIYGYMITLNSHRYLAPIKKKNATSGPTQSSTPIANKKKTNQNSTLLVGSSILVALVLSIPVFMVVILFGAPLSSHLLETFLLSVHISLVMFYPLLVFFQMDTDLFCQIFQLERIYRMIFTNQILTSSFMGIIGCWLGVIPIPLDWDRPWQAWPITLLSGLYIGAFVGGSSSIIFCYFLQDDSKVNQRHSS